MKLVIFRGISHLLLCFSLAPAFSQNIFDYNSSKAYADYLFQSNRMEEARKEYHRVVFMNANDTSTWLQLIKSYQVLGEYDLSLAYIDSAEANFDGRKIFFGRPKVYSLLKSGRFGAARMSLSTYPFELDEQTFLTASSFALSNEWQLLKAITTIPEPSYSVVELQKLSTAYEGEAFKSPFLAAAMSVVLPGSGKIYTKRWKDGLFSLLLIGASGWQAYRVFDNKGFENPLGWFFGGMTVGLYAGNIYGSAKSAKDYNEKIDETYRAKADQLLNIYYSQY